MAVRVGNGQQVDGIVRAPGGSGAVPKDVEDGAAIRSSAPAVLPETGDERDVMSRRNRLVLTEGEHPRGIEVLERVGLGEDMAAQADPHDTLILKEYELPVGALAPLYSYDSQHSCYRTICRAVWVLLRVRSNHSWSHSSRT
jgi:hypothetical protein